MNLFPYRADIDGLRAVAILLVVGFHAFPEAIPGGFIGVDVFFVISGYLITGIISQEMKSGAWGLMSFYARRILRLFPALVLVLFLILLAGWYCLLAHEYKQLGKHVALGSVFLSNFGLWFESGYFDKLSEAKPLLHLWSLAIEEQFYIVWPFILMLIIRFNVRALMWVSVLAVASFLFSFWTVSTDQTQAFYSPVSRAWELLAGALLALSPSIQPTKASASLRAVFLVLLVGAALLLTRKIPFPGGVALLPVLGAVVLISVPAQHDLTERILSHPWLVALGKVSYPLYLWHWPLLSFAFIFESGNPSVALRTMLVLVSLLLAVITYRFWELPLRRLPKPFVISFLFLAMVITGLLGKNIYDRDGLDRIRHKNLIQLVPGTELDFLDFEKQGLITDASCAKPFIFPERKVCLFAHPKEPISAVVIGDSHAVHAFWGLAMVFDAKGLNLGVRGKGACAPLLPSPNIREKSDCDRHMESELRDIATNKAITSVAMVFRGRYLLTGSSRESQLDFEDRLNATLQLLADGGKKIYYFLPVVEPGFDPRLCSGALPLGRRPPYPCIIDKAIDDAKSESLRSSAANVLSRWPAVEVVDPNENFCNGGQCPIIQNGHSIFKDENHLSHAGSLLLASSFSIRNK